MASNEKTVMKAAKFYLRKIITESDSLFIINALQKSNFDIKRKGDEFIVKIKYRSQRESLQVKSSFKEDRVELFITEKIDGMFNDSEVEDSSYIKERHALYTVDGNDINLDLNQRYQYTLTTLDGKTTTYNPMNTQDIVQLKFSTGENNLITNHENIRLKKVEKRLTL